MIYCGIFGISRENLEIDISDLTTIFEVKLGIKYVFEFVILWVKFIFNYFQNPGMLARGLTLLTFRAKLEIVIN